MEEFPLINKTRIFISSAFEEDLKNPRKIIKEHLEESGHEVPIFEHGDFGSWEKNTLQQCLDVVKSSDVFVLLINKKAGAGTLLPGNVTPTYLEYKAALLERKHILVFVSPEVNRNFMSLRLDLKNVYDQYIRDNPRAPNSPFDPFKEWVEDEMKQGGVTKRLLEIADPFVWAFLYDIYSKRNWLYDFDISRSAENAKNISAMLSTSLRSVVGLISEREQLEQLKRNASHLLKYADYTLTMLNEKNLITNGYYNNWSNFLEQGISFLDKHKTLFKLLSSTPPLLILSQAVLLLHFMHTMNKMEIYYHSLEQQVILQPKKYSSWRKMMSLWSMLSINK
ncbi:DUF4062 domain-containing protein [Bacillus sp. CECT 9360]|uniref:DUF4062 domain-containing protein n=1 Tax=Bacillus sp. CECT 9360 TaxID=2845821 RepID=UPI001E5A182C|nr:DUF4062 domain-containing protein [Bacillus sp. CECT 9360]